MHSLFRNAFAAGVTTAVLALGVTGQALANNVTLSNSGQSITSGYTVKFGSESSKQVTMGALGMSDGNSNFWVYCLDPLTATNLPGSYTTTSLSNFVTGGAYESLFNKPAYTKSTIQPYYDNQNTGTVLNRLSALYEHAYSDSLTSSLKSAAFQYAVWEIEGESSLSTTAGGLRYTGGSGTFRNQADAYLTALTSGNWSNVNGVNLTTTTNYTFTVYASNPLGGSQTFLRVTPKTGNGTPNEVSTPGSLALAGLGLFGLAFSRRRRTH